MSFRAFGFKPPRNAMATSSRKSTDPMMAPVTMKPSWRVPTRASPMMMLARPQTTMPMPICTSANPWYWVSSAPDTATSPFDSASPSTIIVSTFTPSARIICALSPAACIAVPMLVRKNRYSAIAVTAAATNATASIDASRVLTSQPATLMTLALRSHWPHVSAIEASVRSVSNGTLLLPITCRLTE